MARTTRTTSVARAALVAVPLALLGAAALWLASPETVQAASPTQLAVQTATAGAETSGGPAQAEGTGRTLATAQHDWPLPGWLTTFDPEERELTFAERTELTFVGQRILDAVSPFDWRAYATFKVGCHWDGCPIGVALSYSDGSIVVMFAPDAFIHGEAFLHALAAHELAHVWQYAAGHDSSTVIDEETAWLNGWPDYELEADCLAAFWGWPADRFASYWDCPSEWQEKVGAAYQANPLP